MLPVSWLPNNYPVSAQVSPAGDYWEIGLTFANPLMTAQTGNYNNYAVTVDGSPSVPVFVGTHPAGLHVWVCENPFSPNTISWELVNEDAGLKNADGSFVEPSGPYVFNL